MARNTKAGTMSIARIVKICPMCKTSEGRYQVAELEYDSFALVIGGVRLKVRGVLPIDPAGKGKIHIYADLSTLQEDWEACERTFADSGDEESASEMEAARAGVWT